jgi:hypothetical protein
MTNTPPNYQKLWEGLYKTFNTIAEEKTMSNNQYTAADVIRRMRVLERGGE